MTGQSPGVIYFICIFSGSKAGEADINDYEDWSNIVTPIRIDRLKHWLIKTKYDKDKTKYQIKGFTQGFIFGIKDQKTDKVLHRIYH